jgi:nucleoid-associated protein Lsr2
VSSKTIVEMVDDLDGSADGTVFTVEFSVEGVTYEIDLSESNRYRLDALLEPFVSVARRTGGRRRSMTRPAPSAGRSREQTKAMREWARSNGHPVSDRGRLSADIIAAYEQAHEPRPRPRRSSR